MVINHNYLGLRVYPIRVYPGGGWAHRAVDAYSRVYPPLMETGVRSVAVDKHTSTNTNTHKQTSLSKKKFCFELGLEFVDTKSRRRYGWISYEKGVGEEDRGDGGDRVCYCSYSAGDDYWQVG
jgi:hypothetical protein